MKKAPRTGGAKFCHGRSILPPAAPAPGPSAGARKRLGPIRGMPPRPENAWAGAVEAGRGMGLVEHAPDRLAVGAQRWHHERHFELVAEFGRRQGRRHQGSSHWRSVAALDDGLGGGNCSTAVGIPAGEKQQPVEHLPAVGSGERLDSARGIPSTTFFFFLPFGRPLGLQAGLV
jgi:hypothetical protein